MWTFCLISTEGLTFLWTFYLKLLNWSCICGFPYPIKYLLSPHHYPFIKYLPSPTTTILNAKAPTQSAHSNNHKHYLSPRVCIIIIMPQKLLPRWSRIPLNTPADRSQLTRNRNRQPFPSCSCWKYNVKLHLKSLAQFQWMQMTDWHLLTPLKASSPACSGTRASGFSYYTMALSANAVSQKASAHRAIS